MNYNYKQDPENDIVELNTGKKIFLWDYINEIPLHSDTLPSVRFGGSSIIISNRYLPECRSKSFYGIKIFDIYIYIYIMSFSI